MEIEQECIKMFDIKDSDQQLLLRAMTDGEVVLILGAGASATCTSSLGSNVRQAGALAGLLAEKAGLPYNKESLPEVLGAILGSRISQEQFHRVLKDEYTKINPSSELASLMDYTWRRLYTWNIDDSIENVRGGVQRRRYFNGMVDKVAMHEGLEFLHTIHLHGEAMKPEHGFIFSRSEYNSRLNRDAHDWYRSVASDYVAYTPVFIGTRLNEPIMDAELDRARPYPNAGLGLAFLVSPDEMTMVQQANYNARNIVVIKATLGIFVEWLKSKTPRAITPIDVGRSVNAFVQKLADHLTINAADVDVAQSIILHTLRGTKRDADSLQGLARQKTARAYLEGAPPSWKIAATDIPVWLEGTERLYRAMHASIAKRDRLFIAYGQSGSGKTTAIMQCILRYLRDNEGSILYELRGDVRSLRSALGLIQRIHTDETVIVYIGDAFIFGDSLAEDLLSFSSGKMTVISSARSGEWREHIQRRAGDTANSFEYQRFLEADYEPLIGRLLEFVPAPKFKQMSHTNRVAKLRSSKSQLLIALKEATESEKFAQVITKEFLSLPDDDCKELAVLVGVATLARTGIAAGSAHEAYAHMQHTRTFEEASRALEGIVSIGPNGRLVARHELYVRHIIENVAPFATVVDVVVNILRTFTKFQPPIVNTVGRQDSILFRFLLNHNFNADLARRRNDFESGLRIYESFEIDFQLDGHYWLQYGQYLVEMGRLEPALRVLNKSIQAYANNPYAIHAYADVQLRVATERVQYDAVTVELIGDAVKALENQHSHSDMESDQYPIVTLSLRHIGALVKHGQTAQAKNFASSASSALI